LAAWWADCSDAGDPKRHQKRNRYWIATFAACRLPAQGILHGCAAGRSCRTKFSIVINIDQPRAGVLDKIVSIAVRTGSYRRQGDRQCSPAQYRGSIVPSSPQSLTATEGLRCSHCQTKMMLERIFPGPIGFEQRLFECPRCDRVEISVIASDPVKPKGWLAPWQPATPG
jgi:hypothetical protein